MALIMKKLIHFVLARNPRLYKSLLKYKGRGHYNIDKVVFLSLIRNGDVVFDIGANCGQYTMLYSNTVGSAGQVHSFEPVPITFDRLNKVVQTEKHFDNIHLNALALADRRGRATMHLPGTDHGQASLKKHSAGSWSSSTQISDYEVETLTLDEYCRSCNLSRLDFIKIDTEGAELIVIEGGRQTLEQFMPVLYLEISQQWSKDFNYSPADVVQLLSQIGYQSFCLVTDRIKKLDDPIAALSTANLPVSANLLCFAQESQEARIAGEFTY